MKRIDAKMITSLLVLLMFVVYQQLLFCFNEFDNGIRQDERTPLYDYYNGLTERSAKSRWIISTSCYKDILYQVFDGKGDYTPLGDHLFGSGVHFSDIFLLSRLADDNKIRIDNESARAKERPAISSDAYGSYASDIAITLLAPSRVWFDAQSIEYGTDISCAYRWEPEWSGRAAFVFGVSLPIKYVYHQLDIRITEGTLFSREVASNSVSRSNATDQFFSEFASIEGFFEQAILRPKGLKWAPTQQKIGFGDISFFLFTDIANPFDHVDILQMGCNLVLPSAPKAKCDQLWEIIFGDGFVQWNPFFNIIFWTSHPACNPTIRFAAEINARTKGHHRIPRVRTLSDIRKQWKDGVDVINPIKKLESYYIDSFSEVDSTSSAFADATAYSCVKEGNEFLIAFGNYWYNAFGIGLRIHAFYDYTYKQKDCITVIDTCFDKESSWRPGHAEVSRTHRVGWHCAYENPEKRTEISFGSNHVISGKNTDQIHELTLSASVTF